MKKLFLISTLFAAAAGTTFADENNVPANNENRVPAAEIAEKSVPENAVPANVEAAAGTQNAADSAENSADEAALEIVARESADDAGTAEIDDSQTAKLLDEALENLDKNAATSGNVAADSAEISAGTDFTIFGHTFHVDPTKTHAPLVEPASSAPAGDKRVRLVLPAVSTKIATQTPAKTDDDDDGNSVAGTVAGTAILSAGTQNLTLAGTNSGVATRSFFSTASTSGTTGTAVYSASTVSATGTEISDSLADVSYPPLIPKTIISVDANVERTADATDLAALTSVAPTEYKSDGTLIRGKYAIVKDGAGTLTVSGFVTSDDTAGSDAITQTLVVREGTLKFADNSNVVIANQHADLVGVSVGGNENATLILDNSTLVLSSDIKQYGVGDPTDLGAVVGSSNGDGTLTMQNNSTLTVQHCLYVGISGMRTTNNPQTYKSVDDLNVYNDSTALPTGTVSVESGSKITVGEDLYLTSGSISVSGEGSSISVNKYVNPWNGNVSEKEGGYIYLQGGTLSVSDKATVYAARDFWAYTTLNGDIQINVDSEGNIQVDGDARLGYSGSTTQVNLSLGGKMGIEGIAYLGLSSGKATISATGTGTEFSTKGNIQIYGSSEVTISDSAKMSTDAYAYIGLTSGSTAKVKVEKAGTFEAVAIIVGSGTPTGTLEATGEGTLVSTSEIDVYGGSKVTISNNAKVSSTGETYIGLSSGNATLTVDSAGTLDSPYIYVGYPYGYTGTLEVKGEGTTISGEQLWVSANSSVTISNSAEIEISDTIGILSQGTLSTTGDLAIAATGTLDIETGSSLSADSVTFANGATFVLEITDDYTPTIVDNTIVMDVFEANTISFLADPTNEDDLQTNMEIVFDASGMGEYKNAARTWSLENNVLKLTLTIPEPSFFGLLAGTFALALAGTRRRRRNGKL